MQAPQTEVLVRAADGAELLRTVLGPGEYVLGRDPACELPFEAELISRRHAQLTINFDHALIEDLGSSNGTRVNGKPVTECTRLWPGQKIQIGSATVELRWQKTLPLPDVSLAPKVVITRDILPEEILRDRKYEIGGVVAQGGMGAILSAQESAIDRGVAMKVMLDGSSPDDLVRFIAEARVTGQLEHPNIVPVHELGVDENDQVFYTMKFVKGITLRKVLEQLAAGDKEALAKYPLGTLLTIFQKVCDAVAFAHSKGVIHRDLKPENIMLGEYGEVLLMDWGLAKVLGRAAGGHRAVGAPASGTDGAVPFTDRSLLRAMPEASGSTMGGTIMGTPQYMAPEQARGEVDDLDPRADIYGLGAILYHILALRPSVLGSDAMSIVEKVARGEILRLALPRRREDTKGEKTSASLGSSRLPGHLPGGRIPDSLAAVVRKAMAFQAEERYAAVSDLQADLTAFQNGFATSAEDAGFGKQLTLLIKRNKATSLGLAAVLLVGTTLGTKAFIEGHRAERGEAAAKATLTDLRRTAPIFFAQAKIVLEERQLEDALEKIGYAIQLDDANADYHLFRAHLRQSAQELATAAEGYRRVLALRPADASANLALCEKLLRESGGVALGLEQQRQLLAALRTQLRLVESAQLAALIDPNAATARAAIIARLREYRKQPGWKGDRVRPLPDGTFKVDLDGLAIGDLSVLQGQPVSGLALNTTNITTLSSLAGLPLKDLNLLSTKVSDLSPLRGMSLESLNVGQTLVTDFSPLRGMKLRKLTMGRIGVSDLSPLAGMPLTELRCFEATSIADLAPLKGAPLVVFYISGASRVSSLAPLAGALLKVLDLSELSVSDLGPLAQCPELEDLKLMRMPVTDLTPLARLPITRLDCDSLGRLADLGPLRGMPLRFLRISQTSVTDLRPLADCPALEELVLPAGSLDLTPLRHLPKLRRLSTRSAGQGEKITPAQTAEEFWKDYDAQPKPAGK